MENNKTQHQNIFQQNKKTILLLSLLVISFFLFTIINHFFPSEKTTPTSPTPIPTSFVEGGPEITNEAEKSTKDFYPLAPFSPSDNASFHFLYTGELKMDVFLKGNKITAQKEFEDFAASKGVDLSAHQINYVSSP